MTLALDISVGRTSRADPAEHVRQMLVKVPPMTPVIKVLKMMLKVLFACYTCCHQHMQQGYCMMLFHVWEQAIVFVDKQPSRYSAATCVACTWLVLLQASICLRSGDMRYV